jgi:hypothetical protein
MAKNYTKQQVLDAIKNSAGVMEYVAIKLNCTWRTARKYVDKWVDTTEAFQHEECRLHALAYKGFHKAIADGERWAIERILDTAARRNGHGLVDHKSVDMTSSDGSMSQKGTPEEYAQKVAETTREILEMYRRKDDEDEEG